MSQRNDLNTPWKNCPTVWKAFCEELNVPCNLNTYFAYRNKIGGVSFNDCNVSLRTAFKIFYLGFQRGGCS